MKIKVQTSQGEREMEHELPTMENIQEFVMKEFKYAPDASFYVYINDEQVDSYGDVEINAGDVVMFMELGGQV